MPPGTEADGDAAATEAAGMGIPLIPLMPLIIGDGDAAAIDMPPMLLRRASRTWSGV